METWHDSFRGRTHQLVISVNTLQKGIDFDSWGKLPRGGRLYGHGGYTPAMRITRAWRVAPAWVRELIDEMDGVRKVGCYWVNRLSGMGIRSPFAFDHVNRILRFKGFF